MPSEPRTAKITEQTVSDDGKLAPRFYANRGEYGLLQPVEGCASAKDAALAFACDYALEDGDVVTVGWGEVANPDYDPEWEESEENAPYSLRHTADFVVHEEEQGELSVLRVP